MKWYKRVFFHVISLVLTNAYVLFKHTTGSTILQRVFRKKFVRAFILSVNKDDSPGMDGPPLTRQPSTEEPFNRLQGKHYLQSIKGPGVKQCTTRICVLCGPAERSLWERGDKEQGVKRSRYGGESSYECDTCHVTLCIQQCHRLYHTYKDPQRAYKSWKMEQ